MVYPRAGGGTRSTSPTERGTCGLSPRRRGNLQSIARNLLTPGSIPAQAGEPAKTPISLCFSWVYPRAGGGTGLGRAQLRRPPGLSPRRRGNPAGEGQGQLRHGSIPAQAGEPSTGTKHLRRDRVYPRAGGGTSRYLLVSTDGTGLSPRRRGNHLDVARPEHLAGSIPAQAGEPFRLRSQRAELRVYPRAGGGTAPTSIR